MIQWKLVHSICYLMVGIAKLRNRYKEGPLSGLGVRLLGQTAPEDAYVNL